MVRRIVLVSALLAGAVGVSGCFTLDYDEDIRQINHYGKSLDDWKDLTNKYFFDYDKHNPFED
jgi:hypothetical protein